MYAFVKLEIQLKICRSPICFFFFIFKLSTRRGISVYKYFLLLNLIFYFPLSVFIFIYFLFSLKRTLL